MAQDRRGAQESSPSVGQSALVTPTPTSLETPDPTATMSSEEQAALVALIRQPILSAGDAISRTVEYIPADQHPRDGIARKLLETTFWAWMEQTATLGASRLSGYTPNPGDVVWLVAMSVDGMSGNALSPVAGLSVANSSNGASSNANVPTSTSVFVVWDATTGTLRTVGLLYDGTTRSTASVVSLSDDPVPIPTDFLRLPNSDPLFSLPTPYGGNTP